MTLAALVLASSALVGCTAATAPQMAGEPQEPSVTPSPHESAVTDCTEPVRIIISQSRASVIGDLVDRGPRDLAAGTVGFDDEGAIISYTVAPGDAPYAIGERLCINGTALAELNHTRTIHPDQVLRLDPDPSVRWIPYYLPSDAPAGFPQIPYQSAIEAMGTAADAGDVDTMRAIWADELSTMFTNPRDIEAIQEALDVGDLDALIQMFS